jgi:hypothetical protein
MWKRSASASMLRERFDSPVAPGPPPRRKRSIAGAPASATKRSLSRMRQRAAFLLTARFFDANGLPWGAFLMAASNWGKSISRSVRSSMRSSIDIGVGLLVVSRVVLDVGDHAARLRGLDPGDTGAGG